MKTISPVRVPGLEATRREEARRNRRNINPHAEARFAMTKWSSEYAAQRGGCMDFWDSLPEHRKRLCREALERIAVLPRESAYGEG